MEDSEAKPTKIQALQVDLAQTRTLLAMDRTLLAWIRTSLSLFAFGFTLARFVHDLIKNKALVDFKTQSPEQLGITLMLLGILGLICGTVEHWLSLRKLNSEIKVARWSSTLAVAASLIVISILLLVDLVVNLTPH
ncbi:MAG: putative rane protein [Cyanobacteriota bacterium erpe_2018_sw_21hr_WHONDRS-SW48-000092_B_bin.40]|nr:putative rane protein [Cyanobacteriota bacterium erpe_2018_sw_21hr_WHONDRS-SW48-000092_B_bin.40]